MGKKFKSLNFPKAVKVSGNYQIKTNQEAKLRRQSLVSQRPKKVVKVSVQNRAAQILSREFYIYKYVNSLQRPQPEPGMKEEVEDDNKMICVAVQVKITNTRYEYLIQNQECAERTLCHV